MQPDEDLRTSFDRDGFVHVSQFMSPPEMDEIEENLARFIREVVPKLSKADAMYEDYSKPETLKQISGLAVDPFFAQLQANPKIVGLTETLLQDKTIPKVSQFFSKPPGYGKPTPPHQDGYYFCLVPNEAVNVWIAMDDVDEDNGALHYVKGSHKKGVLPHSPSHVLGFSQGLMAGGANLGEEVTCRAKRGDTLIHHSLMVHSAGANNSQRRRRALGLVYYAQRAKVDEQALRRYKEMLQRDRQKKGLA